MGNWQQRTTQFAQKHNLSHPLSVYALDLMSELGEVTKEILLATDYGERPFHPSSNLQSELRDTLCQATLAKYEEHWHCKGHIGSPEAASPKLKNLE